MLRKCCCKPTQVTHLKKIVVTPDQEWSQRLRWSSTCLSEALNTFKIVGPKIGLVFWPARCFPGCSDRELWTHTGAELYVLKIKSGCYYHVRQNSSSVFLGLCSSPKFSLFQELELSFGLDLLHLVTHRNTLPKDHEKKMEVFGYLTVVGIVIILRSSWSYSNLCPQWMCSSSREGHEIFSYEVLHLSLLLPTHIVLNKTNERYMFLIKRKSKCTPFWKNSRFWTVWMEASKLWAVACLSRQSLYQPLFKMIVLSLYSAKVETEVQ